ncbi:MAG: hypothetical protein R3D45_13115 [Rhizobiaceae bacterium]
MITVIGALAFGQAQAAERWAALDGEAAARLPDPTRARAITGAELRCDQQEWALNVALAFGTKGDNGARAASVRIGGDRFELEAERRASVVSVAIPSEALQPLRSGIRMDVTISGGTETHDARFSLIGSRRAIDEIAPRCSKRDMSAYTEIVPGELNPETTLARELLREEIVAFRTATRSEPTVAAALFTPGEDRRLLFATLCGSSWYYGNSGCNMTVHAQEGEGDWRRVYETEGVTMHVDPNAAADGWPDLVVLTFDGDIVVWRWEDGQYLPPVTDEAEGE